jgi:hypothetical protein
MKRKNVIYEIFYDEWNSGNKKPNAAECMTSTIGYFFCTTKF